MSTPGAIDRVRRGQHLRTVSHNHRRVSPRRAGPANPAAVTSLPLASPSGSPSPPPASLSGRPSPSLHLEDSQDDRLSKLPDDVLLNIVERLGIVDVARTTVLSRRWKQIPAMLSKVVIMAASFEPKHEDWSKLTPDDIVRANTTVLQATRSILERRAGSLYPIHLLCMQFYLGDESMLIGQTVANTIATQKVDSAEFTILTKVRKKCTNHELLAYGKQFMSFFDSCPNAFGALARLTLENLRLGESGFPKIFSICKQLEFLYLYECDMGINSFLEVVHPRLSELVIVCGRLERVDLKWAPKLTKLKFNVFRSRDDPFCLGYVPLLQTVSIFNVAFTWHKMLKLSELLGNTAISMLSLDFKSEKIWVKPEGRIQLLPVFHKLKILNLINIAEECDLTWTMFLLHGAPNLKELHVLVRNHLCEMVKRRELPVVWKEKDKGLEWEPSAADFKHHNLAELSIYGRFHAADKLVRFARDVVEAAVNLEDIRLYKSPVCLRCKHMLQEWTFQETSSLSYKFNKVVPSHIRIHFPSLGQVFSK